MAVLVSLLAQAFQEGIANAFDVSVSPADACSLSGRTSESLPAGLPWALPGILLP